MISDLTRRRVRSRLMRLPVIALMHLLCSSQAFACSGPGAAWSMLKAQLFGWGLWIVSVAMVASITPQLRQRGGVRRVWWLAGCVAIHPGWWMSAYRGDCGAGLVSSSLIATVLVALALNITLRRLRSEVRESSGRVMLGDAMIGVMSGAVISAALILSTPFDLIGPAEIGLSGWSLCSLTIASVLVGKDLRRSRLRPWYRARFRLSTLLMLPVVLAPVVICLLPVRPYTASVSVSRPFWFLVIDEQTGRPVAEAEVRLIDPRFDRNNGEMQGKPVITGADGRANYFLSAKVSGREGLLGTTQTITYNPWLIQVMAQGYRPFLTSLASDPLDPHDGFTAPPLGMTFPPPSSVTIRLRGVMKPKETAGQASPLPQSQQGSAAIETPLD